MNKIWMLTCNALESHYIDRMSEHTADASNALGKRSLAQGNALSENPKPGQHICENPACAKDFKQTRWWQRFCSVKCRNDEYWSRHERKTIPV